MYIGLWILGHFLFVLQIEDLSGSDAENDWRTAIL